MWKIPFGCAFAVLVGVVITAAVEVAFVRLRSGDEVVLPITERLAAVGNLLTCYAEGRAVDPAIEQEVTRLAALGTSSLRRSLRRSDYSSQYSRRDRWCCSPCGQARRSCRNSDATQLRIVSQRSETIPELGLDFPQSFVMT